MIERRTTTNLWQDMAELPQKEHRRLARNDADIVVDM